MRATWLIAATILLVVWVPVLILPVAGWVYALPFLLTVGVVAGLVLYERRTSAGNSESRRASLNKALAERMRAASSEQQQGIAAMREDVRDALGKLTGSTPGHAPRYAIEALPWYLVIGPPQSGKSSLLASSGQTFAYVTPATGSRGNRGCRFWLSDRAVYIDTAGDYMTGEATYAEWLALLRELEAVRPGQPLHGVIVTLPADAITQTRPDDLDALGKRVRERLDEVLGFLGIDVPVYFAVTRCDGLPGFMEYFTDMRASDRGQVFGFTLPVRGAVEDPPTRAAALFDELAHDTERRMYRRVLTRAHVEARGSIYMFPQWFGALRQGVVTFASRLFATNVYMDPVSARGVYFTSAAEALAIYGAEAPQASAQTGERGYFLRDLVHALMIADRELARPSASELQRRMHRRLALAAPLLGFALVLSVLGYHAYRENLAMLEDFRVAMNDCVSERPPVPLPKLDVLRSQVDRIRVLESDGPPLHMRAGMYVGDEVQPRTATLYAALIYREVGARAVDRTYRKLTAFGARYGALAARPSNDERIDHADSLRLYLMLTTPRAPDDPSLMAPGERQWFDHQLAQYWNDAVPTASQLDIAARTAIIDLYGLVLAADQRLGYPRDLQLVTRIRTILARN